MYLIDRKIQIICRQNNQRRRRRETREKKRRREEERERQRKERLLGSPVFVLNPEEGVKIFSARAA